MYNIIDDYDFCTLLFFLKDKYKDETYYIKLLEKGISKKNNNGITKNNVRGLYSYSFLS